MSSYIILLRGINVGGKNKVPMAELTSRLEELGCEEVVTYINSGNVIVKSTLTAKELGSDIEEMLPRKFKLDSSIVRVLVLTKKQLLAVIDNKPKRFGDQPDQYHSDVVFLIDMDAAKAMEVFSPREGVDIVWPGDGVIYSQRLSTQRTKSRLGKIAGTSAYKSMTIRNWNTTTKLLALMQSAHSK